MRITIRHETVYAYEALISSAVMRMRLMPLSSSSQTVETWSVTVNDVPVTRWITTGYGEREAVWRAPTRLHEIRVIAQGEVTTHDVAGVTRGEGSAVRPNFFLGATALTQPSDALRQLAARLPNDGDPLAMMHRLSALVGEAVIFQSGSTRFETTADEALRQGRGVCQDQSHVFIATARLLGIPARYVVGFLHDPDRPDGEHDPHAWAEVWIEGLGWVAFDCTLGHCPVEGHVRLCVGADAADAAPIRAVVAHGGTAMLSSDVQMAVCSLEDQQQAGTQQ